MDIWSYVPPDLKNSLQAAWSFWLSFTQTYLNAQSVGLILVGVIFAATAARVAIIGLGLFFAASLAHAWGLIEPLPSWTGVAVAAAIAFGLFQSITRLILGPDGSTDIITGLLTAVLFLVIITMPKTLLKGVKMAFSLLGGAPWKK